MTNGLPDGVTVVENDEIYEGMDNVMKETGIVLPDKRMLFELNGKLWSLHEDGHFEPYDPITTLPWAEKISRLRQIVQDKQYAMVEGQLVDLFSASAIVAVYDRISLKHQLRFMSKSIPVMADIAFRLLK